MARLFDRLRVTSLVRRSSPRPVGHFLTKHHSRARESMAKPCTRTTPQLFVCGRDVLVVFIIVSVSGKPSFRTRCNAVYKLYMLPTTEYAQETMHCPLLPDLFFKCCYYAVFCSSRHRRVGGVCVCARAVSTWSREKKVCQAC